MTPFKKKQHDTHNNKIRVALFTQTTEPKGGWGRTSNEFINALQKRHDIEYSIFQPNQQTLKWRDKINALTPVSLPGFDLVHTLTDHPYYMIKGFLSAIWNGLPLIGWLHGTYTVISFRSRFASILLRLCYRYADRLIPISQFTKTASAQASKVDSDKFIVIPNGFSPIKFTNTETTRPKNWVDHDLTLLTVGEVKSRKGHDIIINALKKIKENHPSKDIGYMIVGNATPISQARLIELIKQTELLGQVHILGRVSHEELNWAYKTSNIYVHTPRNVDGLFEGYGLVFIEAGYFGLPCIATRSGGASEAVDHGVTGLVVPEEDVAAIAQAILKLHADPDLRKTMGENGKKKALAWSWDDYAARMMEIYQDVLAKKLPQSLL